MKGTLSLARGGSQGLRFFYCSQHGEQGSYLTCCGARSRIHSIPLHVGTASDASQTSVPSRNASQTSMSSSNASQTSVPSRNASQTSVPSHQPGEHACVRGARLVGAAGDEAPLVKSALAVPCMRSSTVLPRQWPCPRFCTSEEPASDVAFLCALGARLSCIFGSEQRRAWIHHLTGNPSKVQIHLPSTPRESSALHQRNFSFNAQLTTVAHRFVSFLPSEQIVRRRLICVLPPLLCTLTSQSQAKRVAPRSGVG